MTRRNLPIQERLEIHITSKKSCWLTNLSCNIGGYPQIKINNKMKAASRVMYEIHNGEIPDDFLVCHRCDNPGCVNPEHLFLGSQKDNMADMRKKGRERKSKGSQNGIAKLNEQQVAEIKDLFNNTKLTQQQIGDLFGVDQTTISLIKTGKHWKHVQSGSGAKSASIADRTETHSTSYSHLSPLEVDEN